MINNISWIFRIQPLDFMYILSGDVYIAAYAAKIIIKGCVYMIKINGKLFMESLKELKLKTDFNITLIADTMENASLVNTDFNTTIIKTLDTKCSSNIYTSLSDSTIKLLSKIKCDNIVLEGNTIQAGNKRIKFASSKSVSKDIIETLLTQKVKIFSEEKKNFFSVYGCTCSIWKFLG